MDIVAAAAGFLAAHPLVASVIALWVAAATLVNRKVWPKRADMKTWVKLVHGLLIDWPSLLAAPGFRGYWRALGFPFLSLSVEDGTDKPTSPPTLKVLALFAALGLAVGGCAGAYKNAKLVKGAASEALSKTQASFLDFDDKHQEELVARATTREEAVQSINAYRNGPRAKFVEGLKAAAKSVDELDDALGSADALKRADYPDLIARLYSAYSDLAELIKTLDLPVTLPTIPGGAQ